MSGPEVGPSLERRRDHRDAGRPRDRLRRSRAQAGLAEGRDPQVRPADQVADGAVDGRLDAGVGGQAGEQDRDPEGDAEPAQHATAAVAPAGCRQASRSATPVAA